MTPDKHLSWESVRLQKLAAIEAVLRQRLAQRMPYAMGTIQEDAAALLETLDALTMSALNDFAQRDAEQRRALQQFSGKYGSGG